MAKLNKARKIDKWTFMSHANFRIRCVCVCVCFTGVVAQLKTHCSRYWLSGEVKPFRNDLQHLEVVGYMAHCLVRIFFKKSPHSKVQSKMPSSSHSLTRTHEPNHPDE